MRDCSNAEMRDLLPDLLHNRLSADVRRDVRAHVDSCADCREELELLIGVRAAVRAPAIDPSRIVSAIPPHRARSFWSRAASSPQLRIAAAILLVAGSIWAIRRPEEVKLQPVRSTSAPQAVVSTSLPVAPFANELAVGEPLTDLTEGDLHALIAELDELDAVTPVETEVMMPSVQGSE